MHYMATVKPVSFRLTPDDIALLDALQSKMGIVNRTDILRLALRRLADAEGVQAKRRTAKPKP